MNISHMRYAVEIAKTGSITQAADNLYMGQPNMSKAIRELEADLGITIFKRTPKGVVATKKGEEFLDYARRILDQIDELESHYKQKEADHQEFSIFVPRASYIALAFTRFVNRLDFSKGIELNFKETNTMEAINAVLDGVSNLAVIRFQSVYEEYYLKMLKERGLRHRPVLEYEYLALFFEGHPLADKEVLSYEELKDYTELMHGDLAVPFLPDTGPEESGKKVTKKRIYVYGRGSQFDLLCSVPGSYIWVSPMPREILQRYHLVQKPCPMSEHHYRDLLIYHRDYSFTGEDRLFLEELRQTAEQTARDAGI